MRAYRNRVSMGNTTYQRQVALFLIGSLGFDGAVNACERQGWQGTLHVLKRQDYSSTH